MKFLFLLLASLSWCLPQIDVDQDKAECIAQRKCLKSMERYVEDKSDPESPSRPGLVDLLFSWLQIANETEQTRRIFGLGTMYLRSLTAGKPLYAVSESIVDEDEDGNFTITPPERPGSAPFRN